MDYKARMRRLWDRGAERAFRNAERLMAKAEAAEAEQDGLRARTLRQQADRLLVRAYKDYPRSIA